MSRERAPARVRVIVHAGFHKTGTSSLQDYLRDHRELLSDRVAVYLKNDFLRAGNLGRIYGLKPYPWRRRQFRDTFREFLDGITDDPVIFLSWEGFSGVMPGHRRFLTGQISNYSRAAIPLARTIGAELKRRFGPETQVEFLYTLRDPEDWLRSVYGHLVRSIRITDDFSGFRDSFDPVPDLAREAALIARALAPIPVHVVRLEDVGATPQGPATALLDLIGMPQGDRAALPLAIRANKGLSPDAEAEFLRLNREVTDSVALKRQKDRIADEDRKTAR